MASAQITTLIGGNLEADLVSGAQRHVALYIVLVVRQKEALAAILVANPTSGRLATSACRRVVRLKLGGHRARHAFLGQHHFRCNLRHLAGNRFASASIVSHLELDGIADLQMLDVAAELGKVEKEARLALAALNKAIRVLLESRVAGKMEY